MQNMQVHTSFAFARCLWKIAVRQKCFIRAGGAADPAPLLFLLPANLLEACVRVGQCPCRLWSQCVHTRTCGICTLSIAPCLLPYN